MAASRRSARRTLKSQRTRPTFQLPRHIRQGDRQHKRHRIIQARTIPNTKHAARVLLGFPNLLKRRVLIVRLHAVLFLYCHRQKAAAIRGRWKTSPQDVRGLETHGGAFPSFPRRWAGIRPAEPMPRLPLSKASSIHGLSPAIPGYESKPIASGIGRGISRGVLGLFVRFRRVACRMEVRIVRVRDYSCRFSRSADGAMTLPCSEASSSSRPGL